MTMKRILYSCFLLTFLFSAYNIQAQVFQATLNPASACSVPGGVVSGQAGVNVGSAGAATYTWAVTAPGSGSVTWTVVPVPAPGTTSVINISYTGCGTFTLDCVTFAAGGIPTGNNLRLYMTVECPTATVTVSSPTVCPGAVTSLTANGTATTWTWSPGAATGSVINVNPTAGTCYTVNGTSPAGCTVQASSCITVQPIGVTVTPQSQTVCANTSVTLTAITTPPGGTTFQWFNTTGGPVVPLGTGAVQTVTPNVPSTYSVAVGYNTCTASATASVNIDTYLSVLASADSPSACAVQTVALSATASAVSYTWVAPPSTTLAGNTASNVATGPGTYSVYAQNGACIGFTTVSIVPTIFTPTLVSSAPAVCPGETFTLTATGGANAANSYSWAMYNPAVLPPTPTLICIACTSTQTATQLNPTMYAVAATSSAGCSGTVTLLVGITPPLTITAAASSASVCASSPVTITATGASNYTFTGGLTSPFSTTTGIYSESPTAVTVYTVIGANAAGFCTSAPVTVTVDMTSGGSLTVTSAASVSSICPGQSSNLSAFGALSYTWAGASLSGTTGANVSANPNQGGTYVYTVTGDNNGGCSGTSTIALVVSNIPTVTINAFPNPVCAGFNSTITAFGASSYTWTGSTFSNPIYQPSIAVGPGNNGTGSTATYTVIGGSAGANCPSIPVSTTIVQAPPLQILTSQSSNTTCIVSNNPKYSAPVTFTASGATTYAWFPYNPAYVTYSVGPTTTVRPPTSTCYTVTGSTALCTGTAAICVVVIPQFTFDVTPPQPAICIGDSIALSIVNIHTLAEGPASAFEYKWAPNVPITLTEDKDANTIAFPQVTTTYTVEIDDARGCRSLPRLVTVTVLPQPLTAIALPIINNVPTNTVCFVGDIPSAPDNIITLCASNANPGGLPFGVSPTFSWVSPYNPTSIVSDPSFPCVTVRAPSRLPTIAVYSVTSGYNGIPGCKREDTVSVRIIDCRPVNNENVVFTSDIVADTICSRNCITYMALTDTTAGGPQTYSWTFQGGNPSTSTEKNPVICYDLPGTWDVQLIVTNPYPLYENPPGSAGSTSKRDYMKVVDVPNVTIVPPGQFASDTTIKFGAQVVLTATNAIKYHWSPNYNISSLTHTRVTVNPFQTTQYIVTGYNSSMCFSSDTINVIVIEDCGEMFIPNAFSPNGDGVNDELKVRGICLETMTFMIFNRWGEKVFESTDINVGWDGTYHGEKMNTAVFVYRLEGKTYSGKGFSLKGNVTLIR